MKSSADASFWGIHAGRGGVADALFLTENCIALGWPRMGDMSSLPSDRDAIKARLTELYPERKAGAIPADAGQLLRFVHVMKTGDIVVYPSKRDRQIHLGRVTGGYAFRPKADHEHPHQRPVEWLRAVPRTHFSQGALYEIGCVIPLFQVRNYAEEFRSALEGGAAETAEVAGDASIAVVAEDIEETTRDFVLKRLAQELKGHPFADFVAHVLNAMGYRTRVSPEGPDGGVD